VRVRFVLLVIAMEYGHLPSEELPPWKVKRASCRIHVC
jgi:hypothetical protein